MKSLFLVIAILGFTLTLTLTSVVSAKAEKKHDNYNVGIMPDSSAQLAEDYNNGRRDTLYVAPEFWRDMKVSLADIYPNLSEDELVELFRQSHLRYRRYYKGQKNGMMLHKTGVYDPQLYVSDGWAWFAIYDDPTYGEVILCKWPCLNPQERSYVELPQPAPPDDDYVPESTVLNDTVRHTTYVENVVYKTTYVNVQEPIYKSTGEFYFSAGVSAQMGYYPPPPPPMCYPPMMPPPPPMCCGGGNTTIFVDNSVTNINNTVVNNPPPVVVEGPVPTPSHDDEGPVPTPSHADVVGPVPTPSHGEGLATTADGTEGPAQTDSDNEGGKSSGGGTEEGELTAAEQAAFTSNTPVNANPKTFATQVTEEQTNGMALNAEHQTTFVGSGKKPVGSNSELASNTNSSEGKGIKNLVPTKPTQEIPQQVTANQNLNLPANNLSPVKENVKPISQSVKTNVVAGGVKSHTSDQLNASKVPVRNIQKTPSTSSMSINQNSGRPNVQNGAIAASSVRPNNSLSIGNNAQGNTRPTAQQYSGGLSLQNRPGQQSGLQTLQTANVGNRPTQFNSQAASRPTVQQGRQTMPNRAVATSVNNRPGASAMRAPAMRSR